MKSRVERKASGVDNRRDSRASTDQESEEEEEEEEEEDEDGEDKANVSEVCYERKEILF